MDVLFLFIPLIVILGVVFWGLFSMGQGNNPKMSQHIMRLRVVLQFVALALLLLVWWWARS